MYQFESRVRFSESDAEGNITLLGILDYFQDCASFHSEDVNVGIQYMKENHIVWLLLSWQIVVDRYPKMGEEIIIRTMPYDLKGCFGYRNFIMETKDGERLAYANSVWSLIDTKSETPMKPPQAMLDAYTIDEKYDMEYAPRKISLSKEMVEKGRIEVREYHLDTNMHVNNGQYIKIAMQYLPKDFKVRQLRAEYKKQAYLGDMIVVKCSKGDKTMTVSLQSEDAKPYAIVECMDV